MGWLSPPQYQRACLVRAVAAVRAGSIALMPPAIRGQSARGYEDGMTASASRAVAATTTAATAGEL